MFNMGKTKLHINVNEASRKQQMQKKLKKLENELKACSSKKLPNFISVKESLPGPTLQQDFWEAQREAL